MCCICFLDSCKDTHKNCKSWANAGFCDMSPDPMLKVCPESCKICNDEKCQDAPNYKTQCPAWADNGYCTYTGDKANHMVKFMMKNCRKSCDLCAPGKETLLTFKTFIAELLLSEFALQFIAYRGCKFSSTMGWTTEESWQTLPLNSSC